MKATEDTQSKIHELANELTKYQWNCTTPNGRITKIFRFLGKDWSNIPALLDFLSAEKERLEKKSKGDFNQWYGKEFGFSGDRGDLINTIKELVDTIEKSRTNRTTYSSNAIAGQYIMEAFKNSILHRKFNWKNYQVLVDSDMESILHEFDCDFRGDIVIIHKIKDAQYVIVETQRHPYDYDKQRYKTEESKETHFYSFHKIEKGYSHNSSVYHSFEDALFAVVCPQFSSAMSALYQTSINEK